jgi:putative nucleotidyltransferase with HDIG domain
MNNEKAAKREGILMVDDLACIRSMLSHVLNNERRDWKTGEDGGKKQMKKLLKYLLGSMPSLLMALEARDEYMDGHSERVARMAVSVARKLGMPRYQVEKIGLAGLLHDIGKIGIRESVLTKQGELSDEEYSHMASHSIIGESILRPVIDDEEILMMVRHHHERYDGKGYPDGIVARQIPVGARILAVADVYDAMTSDRPYRRAVDPGLALNEIQRQARIQLDPEVVEAFLAITNIKIKEARAGLESATFG